MNQKFKLNTKEFVKLHAILSGLIGLLCGFLYAFGGLFIDVGVSIHLFSSSETPGLSTGTLLAFGALIGMPILFSVAGALIASIECLLYNNLVKTMSIRAFNIYDHK